MTAFTGVVLAGGRSSRMGRDKALLECDGVTLLDRSIALLRSAGAARVIVSGERPAHGGVSDVVAGLGPVGGLASVLPYCGDGPVVVTAVDQPRLATDTLQALLAALDSAPAACFAAQPLPLALRLDASARASVAALVRWTSDAGHRPVPADLHRTTRHASPAGADAHPEQLQDTASNRPHHTPRGETAPSPSLRALHAALRGVQIPLPPGARLDSINTPADWAAYRG